MMQGSEVSSSETKDVLNHIPRPPTVFMETIHYQS